MIKKILTSALFCSAAFSGAVNSSSMTQVDLELQLLADVSGSVSSSEYSLQLQGYSNAFRSSNVIDSIVNGATGSIAVQYIEWSSSQQQRVQVDWTLIDSKASAYAFSNTLDSITRAFRGSTFIGNALDFGDDLFFNNSFESTRQVIDVSGDGQSNPTVTSDARDMALAKGIDTINGITIGSASGLTDFYINNVVGGEDAFHLHAAAFDDFNSAIESKLVREITSVPEPLSVALLGLGLVGLTRIGRKK